MKSALAAVSVASALVALAACEPQTRPHHPSHPSPGHTGDQPGATPAPSPSATPAPDATPAGATPTPTPAPAPTPAVSNIPYGTPVPGKPGYVMSPYSNAGYVDVQGIPPNTEVKDPYSGKIFRVP